MTSVPVPIIAVESQQSALGENSDVGDRVTYSASSIPGVRDIEYDEDWVDPEPHMILEDLERAVEVLR